MILVFPFLSPQNICFFRGLAAEKDSGILTLWPAVLKGTWFSVHEQSLNNLSWTFLITKNLYAFFTARVWSKKKKKD